MDMVITEKKMPVLLVLGVIAWLGFQQFWQTGLNFGNRMVEATMPEFARAADGLPIIDGSRQREPYPIARGEDATFYAVGKVAVRNYANYCLNNSNPRAFIKTYSADGRIYYIEPISGDPTLVTMTSKPARDCT
jgi:hypothetical protein